MKKILITIIVIGLIFPQIIINGQGQNPETSATHQELLEYYAPYIIQDLDATYFGDYITCFNFDGNYIGNDNWENLGLNCDWLPDDCWTCDNCDSFNPDTCKPKFPLPAYVYSSVIETSTHYFLCYAFFHAADNFHHCCSNHENDFEGMVFTVQKDSNYYGSFRLATVTNHLDFKDFKPVNVGGIENAKEDLDKPLRMYDSHHPVLYAEGGGHAFWSYQKETSSSPGKGGIDGPYIHYVHKGIAELSKQNLHTDRSREGGDVTVGYDLIPIASEFWQRRDSDIMFGKFEIDPPPIFPGFESINGYQGHRFSVEGVGIEFYSDTCMGSAPKPPWYWDDHNDGDPQPGDIFMDSAWMLSYYYDWDETFSTDYIFHPFLYNHLGGETIGYIKSIDGFDYNPPYNYKALYDIIVTEDNNLKIGNNVKIEFKQGTSLISYGDTFANGAYETISLISAQNPYKGVIINGELYMSNGGKIVFL